MINFIICDDDKFFLKSTRDLIDKYMIKSSLEYRVYTFTDYDKNFYQFIENTTELKIYILDIETPTSSGIDVARKIRKNDLNSIIIFLTGHEELGLTILKNDLLILSFINKYDDYKERLKISLKKALQLLNKKIVLKIKERNALYTFDLNNILYISKDTFLRKCVLHTDYGDYIISKNLKDIMTLLDDRFIQTHKACVVNEDRIIRIDKKDKKIEFDNKTFTNLLSNNYKGDICK